MDDVPKISDLGVVFENLVQSILAFAGIALFFLLISGGIKFITSGGDPKAIEGAQKTISFAIFGLIIILVSYLILVLIENITGAPVTKFNIRVN